ncbi:MAG: PIN domain-containing protein [Treponemataceae bacterium]
MAQSTDVSKIFVIGTNVLIRNPEAIFSFRDTEIAVPSTAPEEFDKLKTYSDQRRRSLPNLFIVLDEAQNFTPLDANSKRSELAELAASVL